MQDHRAGSPCRITVQDHRAGSPCRITVQDHRAGTPCRNTVQEHRAGTPCRNTVQEHRAGTPCRNTVQEHRAGTPCRNTVQEHRAGSPCRITAQPLPPVAAGLLYLRTDPSPDNSGRTRDVPHMGLQARALKVTTSFALAVASRQRVGGTIERPQDRTLFGCVAERCQSARL